MWRQSGGIKANGTVTRIESVAESTVCFEKQKIQWGMKMSNYQRKKMTLEFADFPPVGVILFCQKEISARVEAQDLGGV